MDTDGNACILASSNAFGSHRTERTKMNDFDQSFLEFQAAQEARRLAKIGLSRLKAP